MPRKPKPPRMVDLETKLLQVREMLRRSLYAFTVDCLGYDKLYGPHEQWCEDIQRFYADFEERKPGYSKRALRLMPRGTFKSTIFTVAFALWILTRNPNLRILIYSGKEGNAKAFLHEIKKHLTMNPRFREVFGKWEQGADRWTTTDIIIGPRSEAKKEPSIAVIGKGTEITSAHYDVCLLDDLVTRDDRDSASARQSSRTALQDLESIMEPDSIISAIGTHWHFDDAYMWIRKELNRQLMAEGKQPWELRIETVYEEDGITERFSRILPDLDELKLKRGLVDYYANYLQNPLPPDTALFTEGALTFFEYDPADFAGVRLYGYWDPASTERSTGRDPDYHAILIAGVIEGVCYVVDAWMRQAKPSEGYAMAAELAKAYDLTEMRVETNHLPDGADNLEEAFRKERIPSAVSGLHNKVSKAVRIESLEPLTSSGRIQFRSDWRNCSASYRLFMEQLTMYPVASHDDGPDALEGVYQLAVRGRGRPAAAFTSSAENTDTDHTTFIDSIWSKYGHR